MATTPARAPQHPHGESHDGSYSSVVPGQLGLFEPTNAATTYIDTIIDHGPIRRCNSCGKDLPVRMFTRSVAVPDGLNRTCVDCSLRNVRVSRGVRREHAHLRPPAGQTCEICQGDGGPRGLHLDHDHETGHFRGWLCSRCNGALGHLKDDPRLLRRAIAYLERTRVNAA